MTPRPFMKLYWRDYLADTRHLTAAQHGAYMLLIIHYWAHGGLPGDNNRALARIACMTWAQWARNRPVIQKLFLPGWKHKRIDLELKNAVPYPVTRQLKNVPHTEEISQSFQRQNFTDSRLHIDKEECNKHSSLARVVHTFLDICPEEGVNFASKQNWPSDRIASEWDKFRDYHIARGKRPKNVMAAWRNWCRSPYRKNGNAAERTVAHALEQLDEFIRASDDNTGAGGETGQILARLLSDDKTS
jgi:uncharacterized protein YdaU (DUF1376 family)